MSVTETHDLKDTLSVEVETPGHEKRGMKVEAYVEQLTSQEE